MPITITQPIRIHRGHPITAASVRRVRQDNQTWLVAPIISARVGVMNGVLYTAEALAASVSGWDGMPLPLGHPQDDAGQYISAHSDGVASAGTITGSTFDGEALRHEMWLNLDWAQAIGGAALELVQRLEQGQVIEVSTGLYCDIEAVAGQFKGEAYVGIARNIEPDHVAILLNEIGACSLDDGCGVPRVNKEQIMPDKVRVHFELTLEGQLGQVYEAWYNKYGYDNGQVRDVYADRVIAQHDGGRFMSYPYNVDDTGKPTFDDPQEVEYRPVSDTPVSNAQSASLLSALKNHLSHLFKKEATMDRAQMIQTLVANERNKLSQATLEGLPDDELKAYAQTIKPPCANTQQDTPETASAPEPAPQPAAPMITRAEFDELLQGVRALTEQVQANTNQEKAGLVQAILANSTIWAEAELAAKDLAEVQRVYRAVVPGDYSGSGQPITANNSEWEPYEAPGQEAN